MLPVEVTGLFVFGIIMALSNIAGIGGGGVAVPIIIIFFAFQTKSAIALSSFSILISTGARFVYNFKEKHPDKPNMIVIDYSMSNIMMPTTLAGSQLGAMVLISFPALLIQIILTIVLALLTYQSFRKAR